MLTSRGYARQIRDAVLGVLLVYVMFIGVLTVTQRDMMYFPSVSVSPDHMAVLADFQEVHIQSKDDIFLRSYFIPPQDISKPVVIFFHGNASHPAWEAFKAEYMREQGYGVLLASYRGYNGNAGSPSQSGLFLDGQAHAEFVKRKYPQNPLILYGASLGSGVAVETALHAPPQALILEVPFLSAIDVAERFYPYIPLLNVLVKDPYRNDEKIGKIKAPVLFLLADKDEVVSLESGLQLFELANEPKTKVVYAKATHADIYSHGAQAEIKKFLREIFK